MPNPQQLALLTDLAHERREKAATRLARANAILKDSETRQRLLEQYCVDYRGRLARSAANGVSPDEMRNFREFIARLEEAIAQQRAEADALRQGVAACRTEWLLERRRKHSFEVLTERADLAAREIEARRLQKLVDEFAGRAAATRATA